MIVVVNGSEREIPAGATVAALLASLADGRDGRDGRGVAVALAGEVVPRRAWAETELCEGARVEVVSAVQGG